MIAEDDGYAEKDNMAFHQACYQTRFGKKCCRCTQVGTGVPRESPSDFS